MRAEMPRPPVRIILTGFSGSGKSAVAPLVAQRLGWENLDTDALVEKAAGRSIPDIFRDEGELRFRQMEAAALEGACSQQHAVIAVGGGAVLSPQNRRLMAQDGFIVCLEVAPETALERLRRGQNDAHSVRPLLAGPDPLARIRELKSARQPLYALCDWTVHTDGLTPQEVADEVVRAYQLFGGGALSRPGRLEAIAGASVDVANLVEGASCLVRTATSAYPVIVEWGALADLGRRLRQMGLAQQAYVITDQDVFRHLGDALTEGLSRAEIPFHTYAVAPGEARKSLATASRLYDWLVGLRAERGHTVVAVGGGVVTDLGGFVAATFARGLPLVLVPTSLLGMVDAAIGGKVAVNHPQAKNMIGAFYQPRLVLADVATLRTLPRRELRSGWAEVIKHAFIADEAYLSSLEQNAQRIQELDPQLTTDAIRRSARIKAQVVSLDEREEGGLRTILNFGHTVAHAIETATGYARYLHGEAVAIGMVAAAEISVRLGLLAPEAAHRLRRVLQQFGLPLRAEGVDRDRIVASMALDKKVRAKALRWVLLEDIGCPVLRDDVPQAVVETALAEVL